jgi:hypothetical protein
MPEPAAPDIEIRFRTSKAAALGRARRWLERLLRQGECAAGAGKEKTATGSVSGRRREEKSPGPQPSEARNPGEIHVRHDV